MTEKPFRITPVYDLLLRGDQRMPVGLYHLHLATAAQLTRLHYKCGTLKTVKKRLKVLVDNGFIQADSIPTKLLRAPYYYTLGQRSIRYLKSIGLDIPPSPRADKGTEHHYLFIDHALELNDILIAALRLKFADQRFYLARWRHERDLKRMPYRVPLDGQTITVIPDAFLDFHQRRAGMPERSLPLLLEHDRGTEQMQHFKRRIRAYRAVLYASMFKQSLGVETVSVAFTTHKGVQRVAQMREWTRQELGSDRLASCFLFAELPPAPEPQHLMFDRRWCTLANDQPIALLEG
ncbi:MAG TPA: replication-relaxation family protein [Ktedonobacteraceae bacterium]